MLSLRCPLVILTALLMPLPAMAVPAISASPVHGEAQVASCIRQAAQGRLWLEKTLWGLRDQEAGWIGAEVINANGTHDLGVLQINSAWVPRLASLIGRPGDQIRSWLTFDPCFNAQAARWIFLSVLEQTHDFWKAVGAYHSPTAWRQQRYAANVAKHLRRRFGDGVFTQSTGSAGDVLTTDGL